VKKKKHKKVGIEKVKIQTTIFPKDSKISHNIFVTNKNYKIKKLVTSYFNSKNTSKSPRKHFVGNIVSNYIG
jgi:hypothetical protein